MFLLSNKKKGKQPVCICVIEKSQNGSYTHTEKETIHFIKGVEEKEILSELYKSELLAVYPLNISSLTSVLLTLKW